MLVFKQLFTFLKVCCKIARCNDESRSGFLLTLFSSNTFLNSRNNSLILIEKLDQEIEGEELFPKLNRLW
jgi:hypothetical protein